MQIARLAIASVNRDGVLCGSRFQFRTKFVDNRGRWTVASTLLSHTEYEYEGRRISALGWRLRAARKQIEAAAQRGETKLLNREELERELEDLRSHDPDLR